MICICGKYVCSVLVFRKDKMDMCLVNVLTFLIHIFETSTRSALTMPSSVAPLEPTASLDLWTYLPLEWNSTCHIDYDVDVDVDVNATLNLNCHVTPGTLWRLADLRLSLEDMVQSTGFKLAVNLQCDTGGKVSLPWPYKAPGLVKLKVANCQLLDKYADLNTSVQQTEDTLQVLDVTDSVWLTDQKQACSLLSQDAESVTQVYTCGPEDTLVVYRSHNVTEVPLECNSRLTSVLKNQDGNSVSARKRAKRPKTSLGIRITFDMIEKSINCRYDNLERKDNSASVPLSKTHFEDLVTRNKFPSLRVLNYSYTGLEEVPKELREWRSYFDESPMELIDLSHNSIKEVGNIKDHGNPTENLTTTLKLQFNHIAKISFQMFEAWSWVRDFVVDIRNNPIDCSCDMLDLKDLVTQLQDDSKWAEQPMKTYRQHLSVMRCATPPERFGRVIDSLRAEEMSCGFERNGPYVLITVIHVLVLLGLLIMLLLTVKYREEIRILLFTRVHVLLPCGARKRPDGPSGKVFDAFVAYAHEDSDWVLGSLLKRLEEPSNARGCGPVKLCIHQRDFVVGKPIIDNIIDSIAASRHTIVVLSKSFVKSSWAMEELQQAYRQSLEERRRHLLVVRLEEVPESDMAPVLRRCCKTFTYIQASDPLFWDRLQYSLNVVGDKIIRTSTSSEYDNAAFSINEDETSDKHTAAVQMEALPGDINDNSGFNKTEMFCEEMKA